MGKISSFYEECPDCHADPGQPCSFGCQSRWCPEDVDTHDCTWVVLVTTSEHVSSTTAYGPFSRIDKAAEAATEISKGRPALGGGYGHVRVLQVEPAGHQYSVARPVPNRAQ